VFKPVHVSTASLKARILLLYVAVQGIRRRDSTLLYAFDYGTDCSSASSTVTLEQPAASLLPTNSSSITRGSAAGDSRPSLHCNQQAYGQDVPPAYNMSAITTPLALFSGLCGFAFVAAALLVTQQEVRRQPSSISAGGQHHLHTAGKGAPAGYLTGMLASLPAGGQDTISTLRDVELLKKQLAPGVLQVHEHLPDYGHLDFDLGSDAPDVLYPHILQLARKHAGIS
jgi:hypothetical protein